MASRLGSHEPARIAEDWHRQDLVRRLCRALDIGARSVERLAATGYKDAIEPANSLPPEKLIAETAVLLVAASPLRAEQPIGTRLDRLAQTLIPYARSDRMRLGLCLRPALAWDYGLAHLCLQRIGFPDADFDALLQISLRSQARGGRERLPHRLLEIEWLRRTSIVAASDRPRHRSTAVSQSVLKCPMDLFGATRDDVYAFTHALMYTADFNISPLPFPRPRHVLLDEAEAALARMLDEEDYDVGGELLLAWPLTGPRWRTTAAFAFRVLAEVEDEAGFLPAAATRLDRLNALRGEERGEYLTATAYHTAYVMGLLCATALGSDRAPPRHIHLRRSVPGSAKRLLPYIDDGSRRRHWQDSFARLSGRQRDSLAAFLLLAALHRRFAAHDFAALFRLLEVALSLGLADSPAASQAAELLDRLALLQPRGRCPPAIR